MAAAASVKSAVPWVPPFSVGALYDLVAGGDAPFASARAFVALGTPIVLVVLAFALAGDFARTLAGDVTTGTARVRWPRAPIGARLSSVARPYRNPRTPSFACRYVHQMMINVHIYVVGIYRTAMRLPAVIVKQKLNRYL